MRLHKALLLSIATIFLAALASGQDRLVNTGIAPGAEGQVITRGERSAFLEVEVTVKHMVNAEKLTPPKKAYFVWVQGHGKGPEVLGELEVNEDLQGHLKAAIELKTFDVFITAEDSLNPKTPSNMVVLKGAVRK